MEIELQVEVMLSSGRVVGLQPGARWVKVKGTQVGLPTKSKQ
jgi:hypothetical protein